ncbi:MAG: tetraacyldisaccharide 4'-kinase [Deltaproteobacteria bacterium]|nr:tetraacyldisaccharide 4'-kinase [Deltaproteobacteria bacterium]
MLNSLIKAGLRFCKTIKLRLTKAYQSKHSVIIGVGSPFAGGSGKTEVAYHVYKILEQVNPLLLLRGYKGQKSGPTLVEENVDDAFSVGDEAYMLALRGVRVAVCKNKTQGVKFFEKNYPVIVIDDAFQHLGLVCDIYVMTLPVENQLELADAQLERFFPCGPLRDFFSDCVRKSDLIVLVDRNGLGNTVHTLDVKKPVFYSYYENKIILPEKAVLVTGIARPEAILSFLKQAGVNVDKHYRFRDHYFFSQSEIKHLEECTHAPLITTEKDWVKIKPFASPNKWIILSPRLVFDKNQNFDEHLTLRVYALLETKNYSSNHQIKD